MDGTITLPRKKIEEENIASLCHLHKKYDIGIVTGSDIDYIKEQLDPLFQSKEFDLSKFHIFPCNGTKYYRWNNKYFDITYSNDMIKFIGKSAYQALISILLTEQTIIALKHDLPFSGTFFQYRGSMLNWCPIGRQASDEDRLTWIDFDSKNEIRKNILNNLKSIFLKKNFELNISLGGSTSFDIYPSGWDKTYVIKHLDAYEEVIFVGDATLEGQNDYSIYTLLKDGNNTQSYTTSDPADTSKIIRELINL
jgi:phosphomannomutase